MGKIVNLSIDRYPEEFFTPLNEQEKKTILNAIANCGVEMPVDRIFATFARRLYSDLNISSLILDYFKDVIYLDEEICLSGTDVPVNRILQELILGNGIDEISSDLKIDVKIIQDFIKKVKELIEVLQTVETQNQRKQT